MRLHMPSAGSGPVGPKPLRPYARADAYRGLRALASLSMARSAGLFPNRPPFSPIGGKRQTNYGLAQRILI